MRFAFAGTPQFGAWVLEGMVRIGRRPELVLTQPARPRGRGRKPADPPVAVLASRLELPLLATPQVNDPGVLRALRSTRADCLVVAAFGQLFSSAFLDALPCYNVHASLLPLYRGPAPIHWALRNGDGETGVSIMRIVPELDAGPVAGRVRVSVSLWDDGASLGRALAVLGALAMDKALQAIEDGMIEWQEQPEIGTYAPKVTAADRILDLRRPALSCHNLVRSLVPEAAAELQAASLVVKVWRTWPWPAPADPCAPGPKSPGPGLAAEATSVCGRPGHVARGKGEQNRERLFVGCGEGVLELLQVQPAGRNIMTAAEFLRGYGSRVEGGFALAGGAEGESARESQG